VLTDNQSRFADENSGKLKLEYVLDGLLADGLVEQNNVDLLNSISAGSASNDKSALHRIADGGWSGDFSRLFFTIQCHLC